MPIQQVDRFEHTWVEMKSIQAVVGRVDEAAKRRAGKVAWYRIESVMGEEECRIVVRTDDGHVIEWKRSGGTVARSDGGVAPGGWHYHLPRRRMRSAATEPVYAIEAERSK